MIFCSFGDLDRGINCLKQFEAGAGITCVKIADNCLFAGCKIDVVHCWDMPTGRPINAFFGHKRMVNAIEIVGGLRPGGRLYTASSDCTVKEWDLDPVVGSYQCFRTFEAEGVVMSVKVFAGAIYAGCWDRKICKYNLESAVCEQVMGPQGSHEAALCCMDILNVKAGDLHGTFQSLPHCALLQCMPLTVFLSLYLSLSVCVSLSFALCLSQCFSLSV